MLATAGRILREPRSYDRTVALMIVVPCVLLGLLVDLRRCPVTCST